MWDCARPHTSRENLFNKYRYPSVSTLHSWWKTSPWGCEKRNQYGLFLFWLKQSTVTGTICKCHLYSTAGDWTCDLPQSNCVHHYPAIKGESNSWIMWMLCSRYHTGNDFFWLNKLYAIQMYWDICCFSFSAEGQRPDGSHHVHEEQQQIQEGDIICTFTGILCNTT